MIKNYINRINLSQIYYKLRDLNIPKNNKKLNELSKNGFCILDESISIDIIRDFKNKYASYLDLNFVNKRKNISTKDLEIIYKDLKLTEALTIVTQYLGDKVYCYDNSVLSLGNKLSKDGSWQPHHDSKGRRLKIYIWLDQKDLDTHPLFYLKSSNKKIIFWKNYQQTRYHNIDTNSMDKIYGDLGKIIIFDTHGVHSNYKTSSTPRNVIELTFEPSGYLNRINDKLKKGIDEIKRLEAKEIKEFL